MGADIFGIRVHHATRACVLLWRSCPEQERPGYHYAQLYGSRNYWNRLGSMGI